MGGDGTIIISTNPQKLQSVDVHKLMIDHNHTEEVYASDEGDGTLIQVVKKYSFQENKSLLLLQTSTQVS